MVNWDRSSIAERQTLPSIQSITKGATPTTISPPLSQQPQQQSSSQQNSRPSPTSSSNHSPAQSSSTGGRDSGNWSMTSVSNLSSYSSPMTLAPISNDKPGRGILNPEPTQPEQQNSHGSPYPHQNGHGQSPQNPTHSTTSFQASYPSTQVLTSPYTHVEHSPSASRRSSFDTRLGNLVLGSPHSGTPAASSQVSLASQLQRERGGGHYQASPAPSILEGQYPPASHFGSISATGHFPSASISSSGSASTNNRSNVTSWSSVSTSNLDRPGIKNAPPIVGSARYPYPHPNAPSPTKGFPYAFPDPDVAAGPTPGSRDGSSIVESNRTSFSSQAPSSLHPKNPYGPQINQYPPAQPQHSQTSLFSQASSSTTNSQTHPSFSQGSLSDIHHHHHLQRLNSQGTTESPPATPYSRTPELRVSHKLAERKRRKEMKELFDELRDSLPAERGGKSSKWEVLTKAIEFVSQIKQINENMTSKCETLRNENEQLRNELHSYRQASLQQQQYGNQQVHINGRPSHHQQQQHYVPAQQSHRLPPLAQDSGNQMQGIERSHY